MRSRSMQIALVLLSCLSMTTLSQTRWSMDKSHTSITFSISHMVISEVVGSFKEFSIDLTTVNDDYDDSNIDVTIRTASISTDNDHRDNDLRGENFFAADSFPEIRFTGTSFKRTGEKTFDIGGNLTIRDITRHVVFSAVHNGTITTRRGITSGWKATTSIDRFDYGLRWNRSLETGELVAGRTVTITVNAEMRKQ